MSRFQGLAVFHGGMYGQGVGPINLDDVACSGSEASLLSCTYDSHTADCTHAQDAGVRCHSCKSLCSQCTFSITSPPAHPHPLTSMIARLQMHDYSE
jgi:hypothetical protein